jgi:hypothetical protein
MASFMKKTKVLLNWDTARKDLLEPFISLKDIIEFIIIWGEDSGSNPVKHPFKQIYFDDFKTPYQLLKQIKPDKILFFNINSFPQIALNLAARNSRIPTYVMHHGIHHSDNLEINIQREKDGFTNKRKLLSSGSSFLFYFSALRIKNTDQLFKYFYFAWLRQRRNILVAMKKCVFDARLPDYYINLSPHNAVIAKIIDHISTDDKFIYIGHPFFDNILNKLNDLKERQGNVHDKYFLLIDFPNLNHLLYSKIMTPEKKLAFYQRLSALAKSMGCRLKIKLHPFGFDSSYNYKDENIDLVYEADMACLIHGAQECFSFFSTLLIPIIYHRKYCYVFHIGADLQFQKELIELGVARNLDTDNFGREDIPDHPEREISPSAYQTFVERYLYYTDGHATERLKNILLN